MFAQNFMNEKKLLLKYTVFSVACLISFFLGFALPSVSEAAPLKGFWNTTTAYKIEVAYSDWGIPHYGAFFSGSYGYNQHFLGPGGDGTTNCCSGGITNWNWWGNARSVLLLPKRWLIGGYSGSWTISNYQATLYFN